MTALSRAQKLRIAGYAAPILRNGVRRRIRVLGPDGAVKREITDVELLAKLHERAGVELDVKTGHRPTHVVCERCGKVIRVKKKGPIPKRCRSHPRTPYKGVVYCHATDCGRRVSRATAWRHRKTGEEVFCRAHSLFAPASPEKCCWPGCEEKLGCKKSSYVRNGRNAYCPAHSSQARNAARRRPRKRVIVCARCGEKASRSSATRARKSGRAMYCCQACRSA